MFLSFYQNGKKTVAVPYNNDPALIDFLVKFVKKNKPKFKIYLYFAPGIHIISSGRKLPNLDLFLKDGKFLAKKFDTTLEKNLIKAKNGGIILIAKAFKPKNLNEI